MYEEDWMGIKRAKAERFQETVFKALMKRYMIPDSIKFKCLREYKDLHGDWGKLRLRDFHRHFPSFPVVLAATYVFEPLSEITVKRFFKGFETSHLFFRYQTCADEESRRDYAFGMVFRWPKLKDHLVLHNYRRRVDLPSARFGWKVEDCELNLETFRSLLDAIDADAPNGIWEADVEEALRN
jgi:hypothetical protein